MVMPESFIVDQHPLGDDDPRRTLQCYSTYYALALKRVLYSGKKLGKSFVSALFHDSIRGRQVNYINKEVLVLFIYRRHLFFHLRYQQSLVVCLYLFSRYEVSYALLVFADSLAISTFIHSG